MINCNSEVLLGPDSQAFTGFVTESGKVLSKLLESKQLLPPPITPLGSLHDIPEAIIALHQRKVGAQKFVVSLVK